MWEPGRLARTVFPYVLTRTDRRRESNLFGGVKNVAPFCTLLAFSRWHGLSWTVMKTRVSGRVRAVRRSTHIPHTQRSTNAFAERFLIQKMTHGLSHIHVDKPAAGEGPRAATSAFRGVIAAHVLRVQYLLHQHAFAEVSLEHNILCCPAQYLCHLWVDHVPLEVINGGASTDTTVALVRDASTIRTGLPSCIASHFVDLKAADLDAFAFGNTCYSQANYSSLRHEAAELRTALQQAARAVRPSLSPHLPRRPMPTL